MHNLPGPGAVNDRLIGYHWVVCLFSPEGQCFYGDPLNSVKIPSNLPQTLNPYFKARFGRNIDYIFNCSIGAKFPNFPRQVSDSHCCGYVCLLVMMLAKEPKFLEFILSSKTISGGPRFLIFPGYYPEFLKQLFQLFSIENEIRLPLLISKQDIINIVKQIALWKVTPFIREQSKKVNPTTDASKSKIEAEKQNLIKEQSKQPPFQKVIKRKNKFVKQAVQNYGNNNQKSRIGRKVSRVEETNGANAHSNTEQETHKANAQPSSEDVNDTNAQHTTEEEMPAVDAQLSGIDEMNDEPYGVTDVENQVLIYDGTFVGTITFIGDSTVMKHDSYKWKAMGQNKAVRELRKYSCKSTNCKAAKFARKVGHFKFRKESEWVVEYRVPHLCENKPLLLKSVKKD